MTTTDATSPAPRDEPQGTDTLLGFAADESAPPEESKQKGWSRRRWTLTLLGLVVGLIAIVGALLGWYLRTGKPLTQLPGLAQQEKAPHYLFSMYGSTQPLGVTVSADGERIYATESGGKRVVHIYDRAGHETGTLAPPASTGAVHVPVYVAISPISGEIYVSDRMTSAIYVYASDGKYSRVFTPSGEAVGQWAPLGLAFDRDGRLYVTDVRGSGGHRVLVLGADGALQRTFSPTGGLLYPNGIAIDSFGHIEVSDSNNARVMVFDADGQVLGRIVGGMGDDTLGLPRGIAVDDANRLYVVDAVNHGVRMYKVTASRTLMPAFVSSFGAEGTVDGAFEYPNGIATDSHARIYITDRENNRVQVWGY